MPITRHAPVSTIWTINISISMTRVASDLNMHVHEHHKSKFNVLQFLLRHSASISYYQFQSRTDMA